MPRYEFLEALAMPAFCADTALTLLAANSAARTRYPVLAQPDGLMLLLPTGARQRVQALTEPERQAGIRLPLFGGDVPEAGARLCVELWPAQWGCLGLIRSETQRAVPGPANDWQSMVSALSSQLRMPLSEAFGALEQLRSMAALAENAAAQGQLERINTSCYRLLRATLCLTQYAQHLGGALPLRRQAVDFGALLTGLLEPARLELRRARRTLRFTLPQEPCRLFCDVQLVSEALLHLLSNAGRYSPAGSRIQVTASWQGAQAIVRVQDDGPGIAPQRLARVFEPFYSVDPELGAMNGGSGLGLTLVRWAAAAHGGTARIENLPGRGARAELILPIDPAAAELPLLLRADSDPAPLQNRYDPLYVILSDVVPPHAPTRG